MIEIYETKPEGFMPQVEVSGCYLEIADKLLLLKRSKNSIEEGKWGVPAGKIEKDEPREAAAKRELFEETNIAIHSNSQIQYVLSLYIRKPHVDYIFHLFKVHMDLLPTVCLSHENEEYRWATAQEILEMPLMDGAEQALAIYHAKTKCKTLGS